MSDPLPTIWHATDGLEKQRLSGAGNFDASGLWVVKADHDGNRTSSIEEIELVAGLVRRLTAKRDSYRGNAELTSSPVPPL